MLGYLIVARDSGVALVKSLHLADYHPLFSRVFVAAGLLQLTLEANQKLSTLPPISWLLEEYPCLFSG